MRKKTGILLHISSLPNQYGIGSFGKSAYDFIDFLKQAKQDFWQILPIHPTGFGDSPYQSLSVFALNPYFIDLTQLFDDGLITEEELTDFETDKIDYGALYYTRFKLLRSAFNRFDQSTEDYLRFIKRTGEWLEDYALFMALKGHFNQPWYLWQDDIKNRDQVSLEHYKQKLKKELEFHYFLQYSADFQYQKLLKYAKRKRIKLFGDLPIFLAYDSADVWVNSDLFDLDDNKNLNRVAGVPPDYFTSQGQLWGNPLYLWKDQKEAVFSFWHKRLKNAFYLYDYVRLDHFIGFYHYYAVSATATDAKVGTFYPGPRMEFVKFIKKHFKKNRIIVEDLGALNKAIETFIAQTKLMRMHVLQFAFTDELTNRYLPENQARHGVCYTGTHDNETTKAWLEKQDERTRAQIMTYTKDQPTTWDMIKLAYQSRSKITIIPWQDLLELGNEARMNEPGKENKQWTYKAKRSNFSSDLALRIKEAMKQSKKL
ncbi:MAG: 4-alpha-glucanotransferase [Acholeplasmataceae bacterium]